MVNFQPRPNPMASPMPGNPGLMSPGMMPGGSGGAPAAPGGGGNYDALLYGLLGLGLMRMFKSNEIQPGMFADAHPDTQEQMYQDMKIAAQNQEHGRSEWFNNVMPSGGAAYGGTGWGDMLQSLLPMGLGAGAMYLGTR